MRYESKSAGGREATDSAHRIGTSSTPAAARATLPLRAGDLPMRDLIDLYMAEYAGRDTTRVQRLRWWAAKIGDMELQHLSDDEIHVGLEELAGEPNRYFAGRDAHGRAIHKVRRGKPLSPATVNRYAASLSAVITWAIARRIAPKGYVHPCRSIARRAENNERVRYLAADERERLLAACKASDARERQARRGWPHLYALVLTALTTGARRGELMALRWRDVDFEQGVALVARSKNGDGKALTLVPNVVEELRQFAGRPDALVFASPRRPAQPFEFTRQWREALGEARIRQFRFHDLRHSCASLLAANGATLLEIADVLGHRQLQMTKRYSHLSTGHKSALVNRVLGDIR